jgi:glyoxylase-like metal-dependent hydrolase (beta-lactamase superfamily II)
MSPNLFKDISQQQVHEILKKYYADQEKGVQTSVNAFLVNTGKSLVLVDSGAASCLGTFRFSLTNLKASGYQPEQVDTILLTHLHPDHVCGISKDGVANFPNATVYVSNDEAKYWLDPKQAAKLPKEKQANYSGTVEKIKQAIAPYQTKQRFKTYKLGDDIQGFKVINTAGHTPGHFSYELKTKDENVVFIGDIVHSHTVQFDKPETAIEYDIDPKKAVQTRLKQFANLLKMDKPLPLHIYRSRALDIFIQQMEKAINGFLYILKIKLNKLILGNKKATFSVAFFSSLHSKDQLQSKQGHHPTCNTIKNSLRF